MEKRRKFSPQFKREAVELTQREGVSIQQAAQGLGIGPSMLSRWRREHEAEGQHAFRGQGNARDQELVQLKRELARVKRERDFLREAETYFAKESK